MINEVVDRFFGAAIFGRNHAETQQANTHKVLGYCLCTNPARLVYSTVAESLNFVTQLCESPRSFGRYAVGIEAREGRGVKSGVCLCCGT